ncbi:hypothetical protein L7F22_050416 [Adiantum nelumboides]|nr:hypothetical protein [Adiantum nelumboides]
MEDLKTPLVSTYSQAGAFADAFSQAGHLAAPEQNESKAESDSVEAIARRIPRLRDADDPLKLTPLRAHYLKKTLVKLEVDRELKYLSSSDALSLLGPPFRPSQSSQGVSLPFLRFLFHHFVLTFPFLRSAPPNFFADKVQVFYDRFLERNISGTDDRDEATKRRRITGKASKWTVLLMGAAIHVKGGQGSEEILRIAEQDRGRMIAAQERLRATMPGHQGPFPNAPGAGTFDVNVIGVRTKTTKKGRLGRTRHHDEFIIRTRRPSQPDHFVSRRYGDFARLADTLRMEHPDEGIRRPREVVNSTTPQIGKLALDESDSWTGGESDGRSSIEAGAFSPPHRPSSVPPVRPVPSSPQSRTSHASVPSSPNLGAHAMPKGPLAREKNRLTLRAYLRSLLYNPAISESPTLYSFLLSDPTTLSRDEERDCLAREALDAIRDDEASRFNNEASRRVTELREHLDAFKADLIQRDGLTRIFSTIKATPKVEDLPESYRALLSWGRITLASTLFSIFVGSDTSSDLFAQLKRIHGLMPYFVLRQILRISNPVAMVRAVLDVFLAQPFGQRSLLQRMFTSNLQEEARELGELANSVASKVEDDGLCERIRCYVYAPVEIQTMLREEAERERLDLMTAILRTDKLPAYSSTTAPPEALTRQQVHRVVRSSRAYELYKEYRSNLGRDDVDEGPGAVDEEGWLYEDLHVLLKCLTRLRDKEQLISLVFEGVTSDLLKDIVTIFYSPLAQVYKAANIADSLSDLQAFINDLIKTVEANEELSYTDPGKTVQIFIDLVARHEGRFYSFVHQVHSKGSGLFDGLMHWIELFINFIRGPDMEGVSTGSQRRGIGEVDLEICLPAGGDERRKALAEIDAVVVHAYRLKMIRELKMKRKLADKQVEGAASKLLGGPQSQLGFDPDDDTAFVSAMVENLGVGDAFTDEVEEVEAEEDAEDAHEGARPDHDDDDAGKKRGKMQMTPVEAAFRPSRRVTAMWMIRRRGA